MLLALKCKIKLRLMTMLDVKKSYKHVEAAEDLLTAQCKDEVPHKHFGCKFVSNGVIGNVRNRIETWLCGRWKRVVLSGAESKMGQRDIVT